MGKCLGLVFWWPYAPFFFFLCENPSPTLGPSYSLTNFAALTVSGFSSVAHSCAPPQHSFRLRACDSYVSVTAAIKETDFSVMMSIIKGPVWSSLVSLKQELNSFVSLLQFTICSATMKEFHSWEILHYQKSWHQNSCLTRKKELGIG